MHRVAEAGLLPLASVGSAVIAAGPKAVAGLLLGVDGAPVVEPRGEVACIEAGPLSTLIHAGWMLTTAFGRSAEGQREEAA